MSDKEMSPVDQFYSGKKDLDTKQIYDSWAAKYEHDLRELDYRGPTRCAEALALADPTLSGPVADLGCGTGLSGEALRRVGFSDIDGYDFSEGMLELARAKECYRDIIYTDLSKPGAVHADRGYRHVAMVGVLHPSHAPPEAVTDALALLPVGGCVVFSFNDETLGAPEYEAHINQLVSRSIVEILSSEYGPHLPPRGVGAQITVLRKLDHAT